MGSSRNSPNSGFAGLPPRSAVCVGFSGGMDSAVLLDLMARHGRETGRPVAAVHVHHGLSPNADAWADFCQRFCAERGVPITIERVKVERDSAEGLEAAARRARYAVYAKRPEPVVALAHHLDDQAETVLLQLLRGTGLKGVAAMPEMRELAGGVSLYRPFLAFPRAALLAYASEAGLEWIDDESNASSAYDRNYLRTEVAPLLDARFPAWREALARFSRHAAAADALVGEVAREDGPDAVEEAGTGARPMLVRRPLGDERRANALRAFLERNALPMPSTARIEEMARQVYDARDDAQVRIEHAGVALVRHRDRLYVERRPWSGESWRVEWNGEGEVPLGSGRGIVRFEEATGRGIDAARVKQGAWHFGPRAGGERIRLAEGHPTRTLKNLLQEKGLTPWERQNFPCLFHEGRLVWMNGVGIASGYACPAGAKGLDPRWTVAIGAAAVLK
ncbi:MAG: tRNA lysidine(34) synthetase TilS [Usitatibacter sp.]